MLLRIKDSLVLVAFSASGEISFEHRFVFVQCVIQDFLTARFALENQCEFSGSKVLAIG